MEEKRFHFFDYCLGGWRWIALVRGIFKFSSFVWENKKIVLKALRDEREMIIIRQIVENRDEFRQRKKKESQRRRARDDEEKRSHRLENALQFACLIDEMSKTAALTMKKWNLIETNASNFIGEISQLFYG